MSRGASPVLRSRLASDPDPRELAAAAMICAALGAAALAARRAGAS